MEERATKMYEYVFKSLIMCKMLFVMHKNQYKLLISICPQKAGPLRIMYGLRFVESCREQELRNWLRSGVLCCATKNSTQCSATIVVIMN